MGKEAKQAGLTKEAGWEFGLRKTVPLSAEDAWKFMFSDHGLRIWLGANEAKLDSGESFTTKDGEEATVKVFKSHSHIRLDWKKKGWTDDSRLQVRVLKNKEKATISIHHEKLTDNQQRQEMSKHWNEVMKNIIAEIGKQA